MKKLSTGTQEVLTLRMSNCIISFNIKCAHATMMRKIISSDQDLSAVVLYNTKESKNNIDVPSIYILQELERPGAEKILQLEELIESKFMHFILGSEMSDFERKS